MNFVISGAFDVLPDLRGIAVAADRWGSDLQTSGETASPDVELDGLRRFADDSIGGQG